MSDTVYIGIDVGQDWLDVWVNPLRRHLRVGNDADGISNLLEHLDPFRCRIGKVVLEATGGLEYRAAQTLQKAGFPVCVINPYFSSAFRIMHGKIAKTDAIDAEMLALFGEKMDPANRPVLTDDERQLHELTARRQQLVSMLTAEKNRLRRMTGEQTCHSLRLVIALLTQEKERIEARLEELIQANDVYAQHFRLLTSIPAVGSAIAMTLITDLPELGKLNKKEIASLVGLAPHNRDSGRKIGKATTRSGGGRQCVKAALYMGAVTGCRYNPALKDFYRRLVEGGKPKKVALTAIARKLLTIANQIIKEKRPWQQSLSHT